MTPWVLEHCPAGEEWKKAFSTEAEAVAELAKHICSTCMAGEIAIVDTGQPNCQRIERLCDKPDPASACDLLSTPCGCEYELYDESDGPSKYLVEVSPPQATAGLPGHRTGGVETEVVSEPLGERMVP